MMQTADIVKKERIRLAVFTIDEREDFSLERKGNQFHFFMPLYAESEDNKKSIYNYEAIKEFLFAFYEEYYFEVVQLECADLKMAEFFLDQFYLYLKTFLSTLVLSKENVHFFKKEGHPCLLFNEELVQTKEEWLVRKHELQEGDRQILNRLVHMSQSKDFSLIDRKIHLYLLGMKMSQGEHFVPELSILDYKKIASVFEKTFNVKNNLIFKSIDRLRRKMAISVVKKRERLFFEIAAGEPVS